MAVKIGYLLPTREQILEGRPETGPLLALAERAEGLGFDSLWVGDSITARPRHEPLTLLAAVAARTRRAEIGTAVLLPALRNPVVLAHQIATLDRISEGRFILGIGAGTDAPAIRAEFAACGIPWDKRGARMMEGLRLCRALWRGEPVDWDGSWTLKGQGVAPTPHRAGGPPVWIGGSVPATIQRVGRELDGYFPSTLDAAGFAAGFATVQDAARAHGRDPGVITGAPYLTMSIDEDPARAQERLHAFLRSYYGDRPGFTDKLGPCYAGPAEGAGPWLAAYEKAGATHLVLRFCGPPEAQMAVVAKARP